MVGFSKLNWNLEWDLSDRIITHQRVRDHLHRPLDRFDTKEYVYLERQGQIQDFGKEGGGGGEECQTERLSLLFTSGIQ